MEGKLSHQVKGGEKEQKERLSPPPSIFIFHGGRKKEVGRDRIRGEESLEE
jgi:hypothetical protein